MDNNRNNRARCTFEQHLGIMCIYGLVMVVVVAIIYRAKGYIYRHLYEATYEMVIIYT